jgi:hypothetical protein
VQSTGVACLLDSPLQRRQEPFPDIRGQRLVEHEAEGSGPDGGQVAGVDHHRHPTDQLGVNVEPRLDLLGDMVGREGQHRVGSEHP